MCGGKVLCLLLIRSYIYCYSSSYINVFNIFHSSLINSAMILLITSTNFQIQLLTPNKYTIMISIIINQNCIISVKALYTY